MTPQKQTFERIFERVVEILVSQIGEEIGDAMQITPLVKIDPEVLHEDKRGDGSRSVFNLLPLAHVFA